MVLHEGRPARLVVLDVGRPVEVRAPHGQARLARVVRERPPERVRRREDEPAPRPEHPGGLVHDRGGVGDERHHTVCREDHLEDRVTERQRQAVALNERHPSVPGLGVEGGALAEHRRGQVGRDHAGVLASEVPGALRGTGADLEDPGAADVAEQARLGLAQSLRTPHEVRVAEEAAVLRVVGACLPVPPGPVRGGGLRLVGWAPVGAPGGGAHGIHSRACRAF